MARDVVDDRLISALHVRALTRAGFDHDADATHLVVQTGTVAALMDGHYDGDLAVGEVLARADLVIVNETEYALLPELAGARQVAVTYGAAGAALLRDGVEVARVPSRRAVGQHRLDGRAWCGRGSSGDEHRHP